ncbi:Feather beta keratin [Lonchura striata]|uniref:Keratin n=2 Tax=Lonchura striata TaxID=40157 RepID=A0A218UAB4_9PASE|nr:Feather beta keratin [Lonchura striata domestica]
MEGNQVSLNPLTFLLLHPWPLSSTTLSPSLSSPHASPRHLRHFPASSCITAPQKPTPPFLPHPFSSRTLHSTPMACNTLCQPCGPTPLANSCNEPCALQCQDSRVIINPSPVLVTLPGPIMTSFPQNTAVGSTSSAALGSELSAQGQPISGGFGGFGYGLGYGRGFGYGCGYGLGGLGCYGRRGYGYIC